MFKIFNKIKNNRGVTLIELMVVISIFLILTGLVLYNSRQFDSSVSLQNLADDIALSVRKAQIYAVGVRGVNTDFSKGYGIHFTIDDDFSSYKGNYKSFIIFADMHNNPSGNKYNQSNNKNCGTPDQNDECLEILTITSSDYISNIYINNEPNPVGNGNDQNDAIDILFKRPDIEPDFCLRNNSNSNGACSNTPTSISKVRIEIKNEKSPDIKKTITIHSNGQISVS